MSSMIDREKRWIFIHVPRTGGTSLAYTLKDHFHDHGIVAGVPPHRKLADFGRDLDWSLYFKFSIIRNPWDMVISFMSWHNDHDMPHTLDHSIEATPLPINWDLDKMDFTLRFENLSNDFGLLCGKLGVSRPSLKYHNRSKHRYYRSYYNERQRGQVAERFKWTIDTFGYRF